VGTLLLDSARRWAEAQGSRFIYLRSNVRRRDAHKFYKKAGYRLRKTQFVFQYLLAKKRKGRKT